MKRQKSIISFIVVFIIFAVVILLRDERPFRDLSLIGIDSLIINYPGKSLLIRDKDDITSIVKIIRKAERQGGSCGCRLYSITLQYIGNEKIIVSWPHGVNFEITNYIFFRDAYKINRLDLKTIWDILLENGIEPRAVPSEIKDYTKKR